MKVRQPSLLGKSTVKKVVHTKVEKTATKKESVL